MLLKIDGADIKEPHLTMIDDRVEHTVEVTIFSGETIKNT
jgi:hypothetical protein